MLLNVTFQINTDAGQLTSFTDSYLASLWHIGQINPAPLFMHQASDHDHKTLADSKRLDLAERGVA